jgi:hypothetical protein
MAKGQQRGNREAKKPKKEKIKVIAAAPSRKDTVGRERPNAVLDHETRSGAKRPFLTSATSRAPHIFTISVR